MNLPTALPGKMRTALILGLAVAVLAAALPTVLTVRAQQEPWQAAVTGLTLSPGTSPGDLVITWDSHPEGAEDYRVRWAPDGENFKKFDDPAGNAYPATTSHTVTGLTPGATYKAQVRARYDDNATRSVWSETVKGESAPEPPPDPVAGLTAVPGTSAGELAVSWDSHPDSTSSYHVAWTADGQEFHAEDDQDWNASVTTNSHTITGLTADEAYKVMVKAQFPEDVESEWSDAVTGKSAHERADASELGDISQKEPTNINMTLGDNDPVHYFRFTLSERREVGLRARSLEKNANLYLEKGDGTVIASSENTGAHKEVLNITLEPTTEGEHYFVRVEAKESGQNEYTFRYLTKEPADTEDSEEPVIPPPQIVQPTPEPPLQFLHGHLTLPWDGHTVSDIAASQTGEITSANDVKWYKLDSLTAGHVYHIQYADPPAGRNRVEEPKITVYGSDGEPVIQNGYEVSSQRYTYKHFSGAVFQDLNPSIQF